MGLEMLSFEGMITHCRLGHPQRIERRADSAAPFGARRVARHVLWHAHATWQECFLVTNDGIAVQYCNCTVLLYYTVYYNIL